MALIDAPEEVLYRVFEKLCLADRINAQVVSKRFASILKAPSSLWRSLDIALTDNPQVLNWFAERAPSVASLSLSQRCLWSVYHLRTGILTIAASQTLCCLERLSIDRTGSESGIFPSACLQTHLTKLELLKVSFIELDPKCINQLSKLQNLHSLRLERDASEAVHGPPSLDQANALWQAIGSLDGLTSLRVCSLDLEFEDVYDMGRPASPISQLRNLRKLHLESCRFETLPVGFGQLSELKSLHLHEELTNFEILRDLTALTHLHLAVRSPFGLSLPIGMQSLSLSAKNDGFLSTSGMNLALKQLLTSAAPSLSSLRLRRFDLTDVLPALLDRRLLNLDVRNNEIAHLPAGRYLFDLESLVISQTHIHEVPAALTLCTKLQELEMGVLQQSRLTVEAVRTLLGLPALHTLHFQPSASGAQELLDIATGSEQFSGDDLARLRRLCDAAQERVHRVA